MEPIIFMAMLMVTALYNPFSGFDLRGQTRGT